jgi:hypothetical protein
VGMDVRSRVTISQVRLGVKSMLSVANQDAYNIIHVQVTLRRWYICQVCYVAVL